MHSHRSIQPKRLRFAMSSAQTTVPISLVNGFLTDVNA
jgi:hypothetical protein